jgi:hypothetical protein
MWCLVMPISPAFLLSFLYFLACTASDRSQCHPMQACYVCQAFSLDFDNAQTQQQHHAPNFTHSQTRSQCLHFIPTALTDAQGIGTEHVASPPTTLHNCCCLCEEPLHTGSWVHDAVAGAHRKAAQYAMPVCTYLCKATSYFGHTHNYMLCSRMILLGAFCLNMQRSHAQQLHSQTTALVFKHAQGEYVDLRLPRSQANRGMQ